MTASRSHESASSSRRALLAGALGGLGAWAASAIGRADRVRATDGQAVIQGADNSGSASTLVRSSTTTAFQGLADATSGATYGVRGRNSSTAGAGVYGVAGATSGANAGVLGVTSSSGGVGVWGGSGSSSSTGVRGQSGSGSGVDGSSDSGVGVYGSSGSHIGVFGASTAPDRPATVGFSTGNSTGVQGSSGPTTPATKAKTGVYGFAGQDTSAKGVWGESPTGSGVRGESTSGYGVYGLSGAYVGVAGESTSWTGVRGHSGSYIGVVGSSDATDQPGTVGQSVGNSTGVQGSSGSLPAASAKTGVYGYAAQDSTAKGVLGGTTSGHALHGKATSGFAGYFEGKVYTSKFVEMTEISAPAAPGANKARLFLRVSGTGKTQLCVRFQSGAVQVIKSEP
jgi:hypothetical protein